MIIKKFCIPSEYKIC